MEIKHYLRHTGKFPRVATLRDQVKVFHEKFGHAVAETPAAPDAEALRFRLRLIAEEFFEALAACGVQADRLKYDILDEIGTASLRGYPIDFPEFIDALGDLDYVIEGTRLVCGVNGAPIAEEIHRANMDKDAVGDLKKPTKPEGWKPPDIEGELRKQGWKP